MNKFEVKIKKMKDKLAYLQYCYGYSNYRACELRVKIKMYEKVAKMSREEMAEQLIHSAGEVAKLKTGFYSNNTSVDEDRKLVRVLTERIKAENREERKKSSNSGGSIVEIGHSVDDYHGGMEC